MRQISRKDWEKYTKTLSGLSNKAAQAMREFAEKNGLEDRDALIRMEYALATEYGEAAAAAACQLYDEIAAASGVHVPPAEPAETATYKEAAIAVNGSLKQSPSGKVLPQTTDRLVKQAAADTTLKNALRDGAQFAWVPNGDTCAFCLTLASRGWQYASKKTIQGGHADHIHANCDCTFAIRFDSRTNVAGYNPDKYKRMYYGAGDTPKERLNTMRRIHYAENKDYINAQKRAAYSRRRVSSGARILDPEGEYEQRWAASYYEEIRHKSTDCEKIAKRTGISEKTVKSIKRYLFFDGKWYNPITGKEEGFVPDAAIAQSWQRLAESSKIEPHDLILLRHEELEMQIKKQNPGISHDQAHILASKEYDYQREAEEYYANLRKRAKKR